MTAFKKIKALWEEKKQYFDITDGAFIVIRIIILLGGIGWLLFSHSSREIIEYVRNIFIFFALYSFGLYFWLFIAPERKVIFYGAALIFDLLFSSMLVNATGGFDSSFFNSFYLITALYSFYFGLLPGTFIASAASVLYFASCGNEVSTLHWTDFSVRSAFLFLLAVPLGLLSQKLKKDKRKIQNLNKDLEASIEELKNLQGRLIQSEKLSAIGRLTADVAHEIRNPLTSIGGFARRLNNKLAAGSREKDYSDIVVSEVSRLERILRDLLSFSKEIQFKFEYQEINGEIKESVLAFADICKEQGIQIDENLDDSLPKILIDKEQLRQAFYNLISNALDVMPKGGKLTVRTYLEELYAVKFVVVEVKDTGQGIPKEALNRIFEPFYSTKEIGIGTGLGLAICKKIIDEHNGLIFVKSVPGSGTAFKMYFPHQRKEDNDKIKCWEFNKCGVEKAEGAANMRCPAYPDYGRSCWAIAGTFCGKKVSGAIAQKLGNCVKCSFYQRVAIRKDI